MPVLGGPGYGGGASDDIVNDDDLSRQNGACSLASPVLQAMA